VDAQRALDAALARAVELGEHGVQVAAYLGGELIVDRSVGFAGDAVVPVFSVSKAVTALAVHLQVERGLLGYETPVSRYWPEYASNGKGAITLRQVLSHRAGVPQMPADSSPERLGDWAWVTGRLAAMQPLYPPGTTNAYHAMSFGWLLGEVVRRTDPQGRSFARFVQDELCAPLGVEGFWFGVPPEAEQRIATLSFPDPPPAPAAGAPVTRAVPPRVSLGPEVFNRLDVLRGAVPAVGGVGDARSLARLFAPLAGEGKVGALRLLSSARVQAMLERRPDFDGPDVTYGRRLPVGTGGLWLEAPGVTPADTTERILCHPGAGGTIAWAELDRGLSVAICHNRMFGAPQIHPFTAIADAVRDVAATHPGARPKEAIR
jgi:CubicO group peptidase (beta-lactamase class C family)